MKRLVFIFVLGALFIAGFIWWRSARNDYANLPPTASGQWVAFGDSLTSGVGASSGNDYPTLLGRALGISIRNMGVPGETTEAGLNRVAEVAQLQPQVVLLCLGGNDTLRGVPHAQTFANLSALIDQLHNAGSFVVMIGVPSASIFDKYQKQFKQLAREKRAFYIPNILSGVLGDPRYMSDHVHPNDAGYQKIAERLAEELSPILSELEPSNP